MITEMFTEIDTNRDNFIVKDELYNHLNRYIKSATLVLGSKISSIKKENKESHVTEQEKEVQSTVDKMFADMNNLVARVAEIW